MTTVAHWKWPSKKPGPDRDQQIAERYAAGHTLAVVARAFGISVKATWGAVRRHERRRMLYELELRRQRGVAGRLAVRTLPGGSIVT